MTTNLPSIMCPRCDRVSHNPNDVSNEYCGACHMFFEDMVYGELRFYLTVKGQRMWWDHARPMPLGGQTPREAWREGKYKEVLDTAEAGRGMVAT